MTRVKESMMKALGVAQPPLCAATVVVAGGRAGGDWLT